jgi:hypothetical protein
MTPEAIRPTPETLSLPFAWIGVIGGQLFWLG